MATKDTFFSTGNKTREIAAEMDALFRQQTELMKRETVVGLTPVEREEYDKLSRRIHGLFGELARLR